MIFTDFIQWAFLGVCSGGVVVLWQMKAELQDLKITLAKGLENHEVRITIVEKDLRILKNE